MTLSRGLADNRPAMAKKIIEYRSKNGKFSKIEDILNVKGIGEKKFQRMKDRLVV